jgi:hypothetical protein
MSLPFHVTKGVDPAAGEAVEGDTVGVARAAAGTLRRRAVTMTTKMVAEIPARFAWGVWVRIGLGTEP